MHCQVFMNNQSSCDQLEIFQHVFCLNRSRITHFFQNFPRISHIYYISFKQNNFDYYEPLIEDKIQHYLTKSEWAKTIQKMLVRFFVAHNIFVQSEAVFFWKDTIFVNRSKCQGRFTKGSLTPICLSLSKEKYDLVFALHHQSGACYGHFLTDVFPKFCLIPNYYFQTARFVVNSARKHRPFVDDAYQIFGVPDDHLIMGRPLVYANTAIQIEIGECIFPNPFIIHRFRNYVKVFMGLDLVPPSRYVLYNRKFPSGLLHRRILNFDDMLMIAKHIFSHIKFDHYSDFGGKSMLEQAHFFNTFKLLFGVDGAGLGNTVFMQDHTALVEIFHSRMENYVGFYIVAMSSCRVFIGIRDEKILYKTNSPNALSAHLFIRIMSLALQKFSNQTYLQTRFEYTDKTILINTGS